MTILEKINDIIGNLKRNSQEELNRITSILNVIDSSIDALNDEQKLKDYDFGIAINLVNSNSFGLIDLEKSINDIKNVLIAKYDYQQRYLTLNDEYKQTIKGFRERLGYLKEEIERRINELSKVKVDEKTLENLLDLKNLLEGKGRRKYYTYEMLESLFEVIDYDSLSYEDMVELISELSISKNNKGKINVETVDKKEVYNLLEEYLDNIIDIDSIMKEYGNEICSRIDITNARSILEFFKENNILDKFYPAAILPIIVYGRFEYVEELYFEKVLPKDYKLKELYFDSAMTGVWINENSVGRKHSIKIKKNKGNGTNKSLYSNISEICDDDVWENIRLLKENEDLLSDKYDLSNIDYIWVVAKPTWLIKKNIELFRMFNISNVKLTSLVQSDLEDKMHFIIELGLLNTPRSYVFRELEKTVPKYHEFLLNGKRKKHYNDNILNYYSRNTSEIGKTSYTEYIYWFYKMERSSREEFYGDFFSSMQAGRRNKTDFYTREERNVINNEEEIDKIIDDNFVINYYDTLIPNYDIYSEDLREYKESNNGDIVKPYYDEKIVDDECISKLEEHAAIDIYSNDGEVRKVRNPYVYVFGTNIISRYKVLRNLSILKHKYGYLNDDMILTAVVHNSYINKDTFDMIKEGIKGEVIFK